MKMQNNMENFTTQKVEQKNIMKGWSCNVF